MECLHDVTLNGFFDLVAGHRADNLLGDLAALEDQQGGDAADIELPAEFVFSSTFNFTTLIFPAYAVAISATVGASIRQGLHHSAQKSTITGWVLLASMTSA